MVDAECSGTERALDSLRFTLQLLRPDGLVFDQLHDVIVNREAADVHGLDVVVGRAGHRRNLRLPDQGNWRSLRSESVTRSALVVLVAEAEELVGAPRLVHDPMAARGVPAHVTVLHPFRSVVDDVTVREIGTIASRIGSFDATFASVDRFPGVVLFLSPEPLERFKALTRVFVEAFPDCPPYGGAFADPHPHLTVGSQIDDATADSLERAIAHGLPLTTRVDQLTLLVEDNEGRWTVSQAWSLAGSTSA